MIPDQVSITPFPALLETVCHRLSESLGAECALLLLYDELADALSAVATYNLNSSDNLQSEVAAQDVPELVGVLERGEPRLFSDISEAFDPSPASRVAQLGTGPLLAVPVTGSAPMGLLLARVNMAPDASMFGRARENARCAGERIEQARPDSAHACLFRRILEWEPAGVAVVEGDNYVFSYASMQYRHMVCRDDVPFLGRSLRQVVPASLGDTMSAILDDVLRSGEPIRLSDMQIVDSFGSRHYEFHALPDRRSSGEIDAIFLILWPHTEVVMIRQTLEATILKLAESQSLLAAVLDNTNNGIFFIGTDSHVLYANRRIGELFGIEVHEVIGKDRQEVVSSRLRGQVADGEAFARRLDELYDQVDEVAVDQVELISPGRRILERYSAPVRKEDGFFLGRIEVYSDVTEVRELQRNKDEFLSLVSHELRTPVTSIKGYAQLLLRRAQREKPAEATRLAYETIERQSARMQELIDLLLDLSRLDSGRFNLQIAEVNFSELVQRMAEMVQMTTDAHTISLQFPARQVWVVGDERRLEQVLTNVLSNAVRYSPSGGTITVALEETSEWITLSITDPGIGIAQDALGRVFERFYRAADVPQSTGMGIGLYVSKEIIEQHGGMIAVESELGEGSTFTLVLPRRRAYETEVQGSPTVKL